MKEETQHQNTEIEYHRESVDSYKDSGFIKSRTEQAQEVISLIEGEFLLLDVELKGKKVLSVGSGTGFCEREFQKKGVDIVGLDYSKYMVEVSNTLCLENNLPPSFLVGDISKPIDFEAESFDFVLCFQVFHHLRNIEQPIREIYRVLKPVAKLLFWKQITITL